MKSKIIIESESELKPISQKDYDINETNNENFSGDLEKDLHDAIFRHFDNIVSDGNSLQGAILKDLGCEIPIETKHLSDLGSISIKIKLEE